MKKLFILSSMIFFLFACSKEEYNTNFDVITEDNFSEYIADVKSNIDKNRDFVHYFLELANNNEVEKEHVEKMCDLLKISKSTNVDRLDELNNSNNIYEQLRNRQTDSQVQFRALPCDELVEIRNVMLDECEKYIAVLEQACAGAVMMAYWYHEESCK